MATMTTTRNSTTNSANARGILIDLPRVLAFFQFIFLYLPFGFCSVADINAPFTNSDFLIAFFIILVVPGPVLGCFVVLLMKLQRKAGPPGSWTFFEDKPAVMETLSYTCVAMSMILFFVEQHGWLSELMPMMLFLAGIIISGVLAMLGLMAPRVSSGGNIAGSSNAIGLIVVGALWILPATLGLQYLLFDELILTISIPPLIAWGRLDRNADLLPKRVNEVRSFAWCDPALAIDVHRGWMGSIITLLVLLAVSKFFATIYVLVIPSPDFPVQAFVYFASAAIGFFILAWVFNRRLANWLILLTMFLLAITIILDETIQRFSYGPISQAIGGFGLGSALTLFFKFQHSRNEKTRLSDFAGSRIVDLYYLVLVSAILGLAFNLTIHTGDFTRNTIFSPVIPVQALFGGTLLGIVIVSLLVLDLSTRIKKRLSK